MIAVEYTGSKTLSVPDNLSKINFQKRMNANNRKRKNNMAYLVYYKL